MVSITCILWCLVFVYGVSGEPTLSPDQWWVESSVSEESAQPDQVLEWKETATLEPFHYELPTKDARDDSEWTAYSQEMYPLFRKAVKELSASEHGILLFWDTLNRPEPPRELFQQVFVAYNRLESEKISSSSTEEPQEATMYHLETTEPEVSEVVTDGVYTAEDSTSSVDDSSEEYHASVSHDGDEAAIYYTTESPSIETMLTDGAFYTSSIASDDHDEASENAKDEYVTSTDDVYEATEDEVIGSEESNVESEREWENIVRRSGVVVENQPSTEAEPDAHCEGCPLQVGSIRGIPGVHFPNYDDIPITSFSCADMRVPGFYADLETGCQVFHVCWPHRRESFLCPIGTLFNQAILACDYWYSTNCSLSSLYFDVTTLSPKSTTPVYEKPTSSKPPKTTETPILSSSTTEKSTSESFFTEDLTEVSERPYVDLDWFRVAKFIPVKSKITLYSKHSAKKPGSKLVIKQKHDVLPLVEEFLELTKSVAKNAIRFIPQTKVDVVKPGIPKSKLVKVKPAAKLEPCLKIKDIKVKPQKPTPPVVKKPQPLPKLDPRFIVKPVVGKRPPVVPLKKEKIVFPKVPVKQIKPLDVKAFKPAKHHAPAIVMKALEVAGNVLQRDILDLTRQALVESHVDSLKSKH